MKGKLLTVVLSLVVLFVAANKSYACPELPMAFLDISPNRAFVGDTVTLDGSDSLLDIVKYEWDFTNDGKVDYSETSTNYPDGEFDGITTHEYDSRGVHTVTLTVYDGLGDDVAEKTVDIKGVKNAKWPTGGYDSIQNAIDHAGEGDTIIVAPGTYAENLDFTDKEITLTSTEPEDPAVVAATIIDGSDTNCVIIFRSGNADSTITGFTITNGRAKTASPQCGYSDDGGGIYCNDVSPTISNCVITKNKASDDGGGIYCHNASPTITNCVISKNEADDGGLGGGIYCDSLSTPTIANCVLQDNTACGYYGGGMYNNSCLQEMKITNCIFIGNEASMNGGGMSNHNCSPTVVNCLFAKNICYNSFGGGMYNYNSSPNVINCILYNNESAPNPQNPCDKDIYGGTPIIITCRISSDPRFVNPSDPDGPDDIWATADDGLILSVGESDCIDAGTNSAVEDVDTDIIGKDRIIDGDHIGDPDVDIGPYEVPKIWFVDKNVSGGGDDDGSSWDDAYLYLQDALNNDTIKNGNEIWVADGTYKPHASSRSVSFELIENVGVYGGFAGTEGGRTQRNWANNETILSGDIDGDDVGDWDDPSRNENSYRVVKGDDNAILDGFTIQDGYNETSSGSGAGMRIYDCESIYVNNCVFKDNYACEKGGAISSTDTIYPHSMQLTNCCFVSNGTNSTDGGGGAICMAWDTDTQIVNCVFTGNHAYCGGAVQMGRNGDTTILTNCTFYNNTAGNNGGALWASSAYPRIFNCILWGNTAGGEGNDIFLTSTAKHTTFRHCDIYGCGGSGDNWDNDNFGMDAGGNIDADPVFDPIGDLDGPDNAWGTADDGLMLDSGTSPCVDAADGDAAAFTDVADYVRVDIMDVDNEGIGEPDHADIGAYEALREKVHFSGLPMAGEQGSYFSKPFLNDDCSDFLEVGEYSPTWTKIPNTVANSFDGIAIPKGKRVIIYPEEGFVGEPVLNKVGPVIINNMYFEESPYYNFVMTENWPQPLQTEFPQSVRKWSGSNMRGDGWQYGSLKIENEL